MKMIGFNFQTTIRKATDRSNDFLFLFGYIGWIILAVSFYTYIITMNVTTSYYAVHKKLRATVILQL